MIGVFNLLLAAGAVAGLVAVCLVPRLSNLEPEGAASEQHPASQPDRLAA
jgi:hypothetical protein